jgi:hypothetical protein
MGLNGCIDLYNSLVKHFTLYMYNYQKLTTVMSGHIQDPEHFSVYQI